MRTYVVTHLSVSWTVGVQILDIHISVHQKMSDSSKLKRERTFSRVTIRLFDSLLLKLQGRNVMTKFTVQILTHVFGVTLNQQLTNYTMKSCRNPHGLELVVNSEILETGETRDNVQQLSPLFTVQVVQILLRDLF